MKPLRITTTALLPIQTELSAREPIFHHPELGTTRADYAAMTSEDFWEVGASGALYSRDYVLDVLQQRQRHPQPEQWQTSDFYCQEIAADTYLLTYTLLQGDRITRRATLWQRVAGDWKIVYHQGTIVNA